MIRKNTNSQTRIMPGVLLILIAFSISLSACGLINQNQARENTEGIIEEDWDPKNPKQTFKEWWKDLRDKQDENVESGFDKFMDWLPDPIASLFGWEAEDTPYTESSAEDFSNKAQVLSAFEFKVPNEVIQYFDQDERLPLEEIRLRLEMIHRAETYPRDISYDITGTDVFGYRTDSPGFVSYTWQLELSSDAASMIAHSKEIKLEELMPGDVLNNKRYAAAGHILLFAHWVDFDTRTFKAYHMNSTSNGVTFNHFELIADPNLEGAWTIAGIDAEGPFYPYRWNGFYLAE